MTADDFYAHIAAVERIEDGAAPIALRELGARLLAADPRYTARLDENGHLVEATLNPEPLTEGTTDAV